MKLILSRMQTGDVMIHVTTNDGKLRRNLTDEEVKQLQHLLNTPYYESIDFGGRLKSLLNDPSI